MESLIKKPYLIPEIELTFFTTEDIIVTSNPSDNDVEDEWEIGKGGWM